MINKIIINNVKSYKKPVTIETDKKINLIYGLNGTGKTTISDYLYNQDNPKYKNCSIEIPDDELILVYNTSFIEDNFYNKPNQDGIFTLSKQNKQAEENIKKTNDVIKKLEEKKKEKEELCNSLNNKKITQKTQAGENIWEIKTKYTGGDRVLEYCFDRLKEKKLLLEHLCKIEKPDVLPDKTIEEIKKEVSLIIDNTSTKYVLLPKILINFSVIENNSLLEKVIIGNENSIFSDLIKKLDNADWVKQGIKYLPNEEIIKNNPEKCPFCQQGTITKEVIANIKNYFNKEYENDISKINEYLSEYKNILADINKDVYMMNPFIDDVKIEFEKLFDSVINCINSNIKIIQDKLSSPSQKYSLNVISKLILEFNAFIDKMNNKIEDHNYKIDNKQQSLNKIKEIFWSIMRNNYDLIISKYIFDDNDLQKNIDILKNELQNIESELEKQHQIIRTEQKKTINIDEAVENINNNLLQLGIDDFKIENYQDNFYRIIRENQYDDTFLSLSEGEKMVISFLYFIEFCKGKKDVTEIKNKKNIIIDDPISSLSHIFIFNIGELIKEMFCKSKIFEQIFILTHNLYFFYEMTIINKDKREQEQKLFRITKDKNGSQISNMKYEEIQNDYQSYWSIINNPDYPPAIQANCMRNIVEYFFNFIEKKDFNNVFQSPKLQDIRYKSFNRYMNRESHSLGQNIYDFKEFDYDIFKEALKILFDESGYLDHYNKMSGIK